MSNTVHDDEIQKTLRDIQDPENTGRRKDGLQVYLLWRNDATLVLTDEQRELIERTLREHDLA